MITAIKSFGESIGKKWIKNKAMPILTEFIDHKDYLLRQNYTIGVVKMKSVIPEDQAKEILNGIMRCLKDPMPNVRMSAIEPFQQFSNIEDLKIKLLEIQGKDKDEDVRMHAMKLYYDIFDNNKD